MTLYYPPTSDFIQKTLDAQLLAGATASATLNNTTAIQNKPGVMIIDRVDSNGIETPSKVEVISFTATSGSTVTTLGRGLAGTSDQVHSVSAIVEFGPDIIWAQGIIDTFLTEHNANGTHSAVTATSVNIGSTIAITGVLDEDAMTSDSAVKLATQQSIKAYVDAKSVATDVIFDAQGDIIHGTGANTAARLAAGTSGQVLRTTGTGGAPTWVTPSKAYQITPDAGQTTTSTSFVDMTNGTVSVVVDVKSNVYVNGYSSVSNGTAGSYAYIQVAYDSGGADTVVGLDQYFQSSGASTEGNVCCGGVVINLAAGTYTFSLMKRCNANTATFQKNVLSILVVPALA